jgi:DNA-binding response OmpR family regulator
MAKVLLVEGEEIMLRALEFRLRKDGHDIYKCSDGREAINMLNKQKVDIVITDIMMPFVSGLEIVNYIKKNINTSLPVIVISSVGLEASIFQALELGADDFMIKPFNPNELSIRVKKLLNIKTGNVTFSV